MNMFSKVFGTRSQREVKRIMPLVKKIEDLRPEMQKLTDEELRGKTREFKKRLEEGATLDDLLPEAFATVREAAKRVLGMEHFEVQLIGGIVLHQGRIAEMKTGEGKTLVATLPSYLNALEGKGVHVVTVNDYLAKRDADEMGQVHRFLGLTVGVVLNDMKPEERREAYNCDITYVTNNELGFDYLRDNMVIYKEQLVQRDLHYCIIDEVDSILIDEARTPLIISGQSGKSTKLYEVCDILAQQLERGEASHEMTKMAAIMGEEVIETGDFVVNEKDKIVNLTEQGVKKVEKFFNIENLADPENLEIQHNIILALRAHNLMFRDKDYVVKDDEGRGRLYNAIWRIATRTSIRFADDIIAISPNTAEDVKLVFHPKASVQVVFNKPADYYHRDPSVSREMVVGVVAELIARKNVSESIEAFRILSTMDGMEDVKMKICGRGLEKDNLVRMVHNVGLDDRIEFIDGLSDEEMFCFYNSISLLFNTSLHEGVGMVTLEANLCGTPALCLKHADIPSEVTEASVKCENAQDMAHQAYALLTDQGLYEEVSGKSIDAAKRFGDGFSETMMRIYKSS